jgi:hypothetical protein
VRVVLTINPEQTPGLRLVSLSASGRGDEWVDSEESGIQQAQKTGGEYHPAPGEIPHLNSVGEIFDDVIIQ